VKLHHSDRSDGDSWRMERHYGSFERAIALPFDVKDGQVDATFSNDVLSIRIPKPPTSSVRPARSR
jgi:HSP20 family protein